VPLAARQVFGSLAKGISICFTTQKPASVQLAYCTLSASFSYRITKPGGPLPARGRVSASGIGGESDLSAALILLFGTAGHGNGTHDVAALHDGNCPAAGHDATGA